MDFLEIPEKVDQLQTYYETIPSLIPVKNRSFIATTHIGLRPSQEDRFIIIPNFFSDSISFCGVFDGTVGSDASDFVQKNIIKHFCSKPEVAEILKSIQTEDVKNEKLAKLISSALRSAFQSSDSALIQMCTEHKLHYASSTGVVSFLVNNLLTIAHIGDSKACIARMKENVIQPEWLTVDHKPNMPNELRRIEENGGSLAWLHGNKPYIRGGDFFPRQQKNEHPKQLNYSRAFGGKDLKMYGLSCEPDINHFEIGEEDKLLLIASDGLWDVLHPKLACDIAMQAKKKGTSASDDIVRRAIQEMPLTGVRDNISVIAIFLND